ncbi:MAG: hypothetical protein ACOX4G_14445 [Limnochordia bacterium]|jgi:hypothetical protein
MLSTEAWTKKIGLVFSLLLFALILPIMPVCAQDDTRGEERRLMRVEENEEGLAPASGFWSRMLRFDATATYEYALTRWTDGAPVHGSLTIQVAKLHSGLALSLSYEIDGRREGVFVRPLASTPAEALMATLLASAQWSLEDIRLLWTPFAFTPWATRFVEMPWRAGEGWTVRSLGNESFRVEEVARDGAGRTIYRGRLQRYGETTLLLEIDLNLPLPAYVHWVDAAGMRYEAQIKSSHPR